MAQKRKKYAPEPKVQILKSHLADQIPISDLCDPHGRHPTVFYRWQKSFFENGANNYLDTHRTVFQEVRCK